MSTDRKIKGHAGSYGVAKYGLFVFRISAQPGIRPTGLGGLVYHVTGQAAVRQKRRVGVVAAQVGAHRRRVCIGVAVFAQMTAGVIGADTYLLLLRWKGSSLSIERSTGPFSQIFRFAQNLDTRVRIPTTQNIIKSRKTQKRSTAFWYAGRDSNPRPSGS